MDGEVSNGTIGPMEPTSDVQAEIRQFLEHRDRTRLGAVYSGLERGLSAQEIADELDVSTNNFVSFYRQILRALVDGKMPSAPTIAVPCERAARRLLREGVWSAEARDYLQNNMDEFQKIASNEVAIEVEDEQAKIKTEQAESKNVPGIYVYTLPHYLRHPADPSGRTLMKVGHSERDVIKRFREQGRTTALPEEPILLRIYPTQGSPSAKLESTFHRLLESADHYRSVARTAGREWFVTSTRFLDEVAAALGLEVQVVSASEVDDY